MSSASDRETAPVRGGFSITLCVVIPDVDFGQPEAWLEPAHVLKRDLVAPCEPDDQAGRMRLVLVIPKDITLNQRGHLLEKLLLPVRPVVLSVWTMNFWCVGVAQVDRPSAAHDGIGEAGERRRSRVCVWRRTLQVQDGCRPIFSYPIAALGRDAKANYCWA